VKRMKHAGLFAAAVGVFVGVIAVMFGILLASEGLHFGRKPPSSVALLMISLCLFLQACGGFLLFYSGLAFRSRKDWARRALLGFIWYLRVYAGMFLAYWAMSFLAGMELPTIAFKALIACGFVAFAGGCLQYARLDKFLSSPEVVEACRARVRAEGAQPRKKAP